MSFKQKMGQGVSYEEEEKVEKVHVPTFIELMQKRAQEAQDKEVALVDAVLDALLTKEARAQDVTHCVNSLMTFIDGRTGKGLMKFDHKKLSPLMAQAWKNGIQDEATRAQVYIRQDAHFDAIRNEFMRRTGLKQCKGEYEYRNGAVPRFYLGPFIQNGFYDFGVCFSSK